MKPTSGSRKSLLLSLSQELDRSLWFLSSSPELLFQSLYNGLAALPTDWAREWVAAAGAARAGRPGAWIEDLAPAADRFLRYRLSVKDVAHPHDCSISGNGRAAVVAGMEGDVRWYELSNGILFSQLRLLGLYRLSRCDFDHGGSQVVLTYPSKPLLMGDDVLGVWDGGARAHDLVRGDTTFVDVALSAEGDRCAAATDSGQIWLWRCPSGERLFVVPVGPRPRQQSGLSFGARGQFLVAAVAGRLVVISADVGRIVADVDTGLAEIEDCCASDSPFRIVAVGKGTLLCYNAAPVLNERMPTLVGRQSLPSSAPSCCATSADGRRVVTGSASGGVRLWIGDRLEPAAVFATTHSVVAVDCSGDGQRVAALDFAALHIWDVPPESAPSAEAPAFAAVGPISTDFLGRYATFSDREGGVRLFAERSLQQVQLPLYSKPLRVCLLSPDAEHLITASDEPEVRISAIPDGVTEHVLRGHSDVINWAQFSPDGAFLLTAAADRSLGLWAVESGALVARLRGHGASVADCLFTPDGVNAFSLDASGELRRWIVPSGEADGVLLIEGACQLFASLDGHDLYVATRHSQHLVLDATSLRQRGEFGAHAYVFDTMALLPRSGFLAAVAGFRPGRVPAMQHELGLWKRETFQLERKLPGHDHEVRVCGSLPDGLHLISGGEDSWLRVWNTLRGTLVAAIPTRAPAQRLAVSNGGTYIGAQCLGSGWGLYRLHGVETALPPATVAWVDSDRQLSAACPICRAEFGFGRAIFALDHRFLGQETHCPAGHGIWIAAWPLPRTPVWCDPGYRREYWPRGGT